MKIAFNGLNFLNHLLGVNDPLIAQVDLFLTTVTPKDNPLLVGQKLHEMGFVIPDDFSKVNCS
jgi:hypothetical protein